MNVVFLGGDIDELVCMLLVLIDDRIWYEFCL